MLPSSNTMHRISGLPDQLHRHAASSTEREAPKHSGRMIHCTQMGLAQALLHYCALQQQHISILRHQKLSYQSRTKISLSNDSLTDLQWWISPQIIQFNNTPLTLPAFDMVIYTDASTQGWGAQSNGILTGGRWTPQESRNHINVRVKSCPTGHQVLSLRSGAEATAHQSTDGQFYRSCLRQQERRNQVINAGGVSSQAMGSLPSEQHMDNSTTPSWNSECRCGLGLMSLQRTHGVDSGLWSGLSIFTRIVRKFYTPQVDLFASRLNHQLPKYVSQHPDPEVMSVDAMTLEWNKWTSFIHPPIVMLPRILKKIREDQATCLLIAPNWPAQTWYPLLLQLLIDIPTILPMSEHTIYLPFNRQARHPLWRTLKLAVWPLSGDAVKQEVFHHRCATYSWPPSEMEQRKDTRVPGSYGLAVFVKEYLFIFSHYNGSITVPF